MVLRRIAVANSLRRSELARDFFKNLRQQAGSYKEFSA
jgi:hypothetical protein